MHPGHQYQYAQQTRAELMGGPCDGEKINIGLCEELSDHVARHTAAFVHYYLLGKKGGLWVYLHHSVERRACGR